MHIGGIQNDGSVHNMAHSTYINLQYDPSATISFNITASNQPQTLVYPRCCMTIPSTREGWEIRVETVGGWVKGVKVIGNGITFEDSSECVKLVSIEIGATSSNVN